MGAEAIEKMTGVAVPGSSMTDMGMEVICQAPNLEWLDISDTRITGASMSQLEGKQLESFVAKNLDLTGASWESLSTERLRAIYVTGATVSTESFATFLEQSDFSALHTLNVSESNMDERTIEAISGLISRNRPNDYGRLLYLADTAVSDQHIALFEGSTIHTLDLSGTKVTDDCVESLAMIEGLHELQLSRTKITDDALPTLLSLGCKVLGLKDTQVTAQGILKLKGEQTIQLEVSQGQFTMAEKTSLQNAGFLVMEPDD